MKTRVISERHLAETHLNMKPIILKGIAAGHITKIRLISERHLAETSTTPSSERDSSDAAADAVSSIAVAADVEPHTAQHVADFIPVEVG